MFEATADRFPAVLLAAAVAALALAGCGGGGGGGGERTPVAPTTANLWVSPTAGGAPKRCATPCSYDATAAYGDFRSAYQAARPGDVVRVKAGSYGAQKLGPTNQDLDAPVTFQAAHGEKVRLTLLETDADWLTFKDMTITAGRAPGRGWRSTGSHIRLDRMAITGPEATIRLSDGGSDVTFANSELGTKGNTTIRRCANHNPGPVEVQDTTRFTLYNVTFWPFLAELNNLPDCGGDGNMHLETVRINDNVQHLVLDRVRFMDGDGSGSGRLLESGAGGKASSDALIANSYFGRADGPGGSGNGDIHLAGGTNQCDGWVFAYNYWTGGIVDDQCHTPPRYIGNLGTMPDYRPCPGSDSSHNLWVWSAAKSGCGTDRWLVHPDPMLAAYQQAADGFHLTASSPAVDAGEEELCKRYTGGVDIDGQRRQGPCDAGPDEYVP